MTPLEDAARKFARIYLSSDRSDGDVTRRIRDLLGRKPRWLQPVLRVLASRFGPGRRPRSERIERVLKLHPQFIRACAFGQIEFPAEIGRPSMSPAPGPPRSWPIPKISTKGELGSFLGLDPGELEWLADLRGWNRTDTLNNYRRRLEPKRSGGQRLLEIPKARLKGIQRRILKGILDRIPIHDAVHGFVHRRSIRTFVEPHCGKEFVLRMDMRDFFPSIHRGRVVAILLTAGYPQPVACRIAGLCTTTTPWEILRSWKAANGNPEDGARMAAHRIPHLPQGAPTSPALSNIAAFRLDRRLAGLARAAGANYTRYADDLLFSGGYALARTWESFRLRVSAIALSEGFVVHERKTRAMRPGVAQRAVGIVLNSHPNPPRAEFDSLKAVLHNSARLGLESQNHEGHPDFLAHLAGRVAHMTHVNPIRGAKLKALLDRIG